MRIIDAEELIKDFQGRYIEAENWIKRADEDIKPRAEATAAFIIEVLLTIKDAPVLTNVDIIREFPTIINAPRGHWKIVDDDDGLKLCECSICGRREEIINFINYPFCHCGALMEHPGLKYEADDKNDGGEE